MVHTKATNPGGNNPPPEVGGTSNNNNVAALEAQIAEMSRDMATLTVRNLGLLERFPSERIPKESEENDRDERDAHMNEDMNLENQGGSREN
jgi:hypothetical protein